MYFVGDDEGPKGRRRIGFANEGDADVLEEDRFFRVLLKYSYKHSLMGAANITGEREGHGDNGIVSGHAYSILQVRRAGTTLGMGGIKLLQLRNPWGTFEWNGAWSDGSDEWKKHPGVASEVGYNETDDGTFWMEYKDFARTFNMVDICDRTTKDDLRLDVNEDEGCLGPMKRASAGADSSGAAAWVRASYTAVTRPRARRRRARDAASPAEIVAPCMKSQQPHFHFGVHTTLKTAVHSSWPADFGKRPSEADGTVRDEGSRRARERPAGVRDRRKAVSGRRRPPHAASAALAPLEPRLGAARLALRSGSLLPSSTRARRRGRVHRVRSRAGGARADMHRRVRSAARGRGQAAELQAHPA